MSRAEIRMYGYEGCDSCRAARRFLAARGVEYESLAIREQPPEEGELREMAARLGDWGKVFNRSGREYREQGLKDIVPHLSDGELVGRLRAEGNLVKRPFLVCGDGRGAVGFKLAEWEALFPELGGVDRGTGGRAAI